MSSVIAAPQKLFGLIELDAAGTVLYSLLEGDGKCAGAAADVAGHNFYSEVAGFTNVEEFQQRLEDFKESSELADSFVFNCKYEEGGVLVRVLLARIGKRTNGESAKSLLMHIKKA